MSKGFIIDAPNAYIESGTDSQHTVTASSGQVQLQGSTIDINGGQSLYSLTSIPGQTQLNITLTNAMFDSDGFKISTGATETLNTTVNRKIFGTPYIVDPVTFKIFIPEDVVVGSVKIKGLTEVLAPAVPAVGQFLVAYGVTVGTVLGTEVTFEAGMAGKSVLPAYDIAVAGSDTYDIMIDSIPKKGQVWIDFPIYSNDSVDSSIEAIGQFHFYSAMINLNNTFGGAYKTPSTFEVQIKGLNSNRPDRKVFSFNIIPV